MRRPRPDARHFGQGGLDLFVRHARKCRVAQPPVDESVPRALATSRLCDPRGRLCEAPADRPPAPRPATAGVRRIALRDGRRSSVSPRRRAAARRPEDEGAESVERGQLLQPRPRTELRPRVDQAREDWIGITKEIPRLRIGDGCDRHFRRLSVSVRFGDVGEMRRQEPSGPVERRGRFVEDRVIGLEDVGHPGVMSSVTSTSAVAACRARRTASSRRTS